MADWFAEAAKYFGKLKAGRSPLVEKMEEVAGIEKTVLPPVPPPVVKPEPEKKLKEKSTGGSLPFTDVEIKKGYRRL